MGTCCSRGNELLTKKSITSAEEQLALRLLSLEPSIDHNIIQTYTWKRLRKFLKANKYNVELSLKAVVSDINWKIKHLPISFERWQSILKTKRIFLFEKDSQEHPVVVIKPCHPLKDFIASCCDFLAYFIENIQPSISLKNKLCLLVDFQEGPLEKSVVLEINEFMHKHYPCKLKHILVVKSKIDSLTLSDRSALRELPHLKIFKSDFKKYLFEYIEVDNLLSEYGGLRQYFFQGNTYGQLS